MALTKVNSILVDGAITTDASGNVGIGTASPTEKLQVEGGILINTSSRYRTLGLGESGTRRGYLTYDTEANSLGLIAEESGSFLQFGTANTERARIDTNGNLLVGTTTSLNTSKVTLNTPTAGSWSVGPAFDYNVFFVLNSSAVGAYIASGGTSWTANSDERLKTALVPFENAIEKVSSLRAGTGRYLTDDESVSRSFLIAQDVQKVLPEAVDATNPDKLGIQYTEVIPLLVAAIKEQQAIINDLKARIETLEAK